MVPVNDILFMKDLKRAGWLRLGVSDPESVADHSFSVATLSLFLCPDTLDITRVLKLALLHDLAESRVGDITPHQTDITPQEKIDSERSAIRQITDSEKLIELFDEYLDQSSPEAEFVLKMDKLEMALQALRYFRQGKLKSPDEFIDNALTLLGGTEFESMVKE